jgi:serine/threonine protein kinase
MPAPATITDFLDVVRKSQQVDASRLDAFLRRPDALPGEPRALAALLVRAGVLTAFQAEQFLLGKHRGFTLGGYRILERLGSGGSGTVYLAEHLVMKRRVALKVLPAAYADDPAVLGRFRREAQAAAALDHPNIVRAYDFRQEGLLYFLVMEYVNGPSLQEVLQRQGPLPVAVACDYVRQAAVGLQHAHEHGLVHRDVKPANLLVDASGTVKVLDLGLARFTPDGQESVTRQFDENLVMGTADYLAPEQAVSLHNVDSRADVYSLGATFYALLSGEPPFHQGTITQKLLWHQMRDPPPLRDRRPDVPDEVAALVAAMMAKSTQERVQTASEVAALVGPWCAGGPNPQGPPAPGGRPGGTTASYFLPGPTTPGSAAVRHRTPVPAARTVSAARGPGARKPTSVARQAGPGGNLVLLLLGAVLGAVVLAAAGVTAFLVWGPVPDPGLPAVAGKGGKALPPAPLPDRVGQVLLLPDGLDGSDRAAFAPDGAHVAAAGYDHAARVFDLRTQAPPVLLRGHTGKLTYVAFSHKGLRLLSSSADGTVRLWDVAGRREVRQYPGHTKTVWCALFSADDRWVLTGGEDNVVRLFETESGRLVHAMTGHTAAVNSVAFRPGGREAVSAGWDGALRVWDLAAGKEVRRLPAHQGRASTVACTPDGAAAVSGGSDGAVRLWDLATGRELHTFAGHAGEVWIVAVSPDGRRALSAGTDRVIRLWDLKKRQLQAPFAGHTLSVTGVAFAPDGKHFVSSSGDGTVRVWGLPPAP